MALDLRTIKAVAEELNISRQAVHKKIKAGYPTIGEGRGLRINRNDPEWAIWIEEKKHSDAVTPPPKPTPKKRSKSTQTKQSKKKAQAPTPPFIPGDEEEEINSILQVNTKNLAEVQKITLDKLKLVEQTRQIQDKRLRERNEHIPRSLVARVLAKLYDVDINEHIQIAGKASSAIAAALGIEKSEDILKIEEILTPELYRTLEHRKRIMNDFLDEVGGELVEGDG